MGPVIYNPPFFIALIGLAFLTCLSLCGYTKLAFTCYRDCLVTRFNIYAFGVVRAPTKTSTIERLPALDFH